MRHFLGLLISALLFFSCSQAQPQHEQQQEQKARLVGGPCEGCEAVIEFGTRKLTATDTLPDFLEGKGMKLKVKGTVYQPDGKSPAPDVVIYAYHTNQEGLYASSAGAKGWAKRHGDIRGWVKTDENGHFAFYTLKPAAYPSRSAPAHIHYTLLEPNGKYYWVASSHFAGDSLLTKRETKPEAPRGGNSGLLALKKEGELWLGTQDIILGKNVPGYE